MTKEVKENIRITIFANGGFADWLEKKANEADLKPGAYVSMILRNIYIAEKQAAKDGE